LILAGYLPADNPVMTFNQINLERVTNMSTGVQSSVVLDSSPTQEMLDVFGNLFGRTITVTNLTDGRVHVSCFSPVESMHADLGAALRSSAIQLKADLAGLRQP
jgi:hypothetical protein